MSMRVSAHSVVSNPVRDSVVASIPQLVDAPATRPQHLVDVPASCEFFSLTFSSVPIESLTVVSAVLRSVVGVSHGRSSLLETELLLCDNWHVARRTPGHRAQALSLRGGAESSLCHRGMHISQVFHAFGAAMETCVCATVHRAGVVSIALWTLVFRLFDFDLCETKSCQV